MNKTAADLYADINAFGLIVKSIEADGSIHRTATADKPRSKNGWYVANEVGEIIVAVFGNHRTGEQIKWTSRGELTHAERESIRAWQEKAEIERQKSYTLAAAFAEGECARAAAADVDHPYLKAKGIKSHGALQLTGQLLLPAFNEKGEIRTYQTISPTGEKKMLWKGEMKDHYHLIGTGRPQVICEGFATGASIHEKTGLTVAVAFSAGNIPNVARFFPDAIAAPDNDENGTGEKFAKKSGLKYVLPARVGWDFNDMVSAGEDIRPFFPSSTVAPARFHYIKATDVTPVLDANDFVQGLLEDSKLSVIYGPSNCGKTFFATDLCMHVALGWQWRGRRVQQRNVMYVAMEGATGLGNRISAFKQRYDCTPDKFIIVPHTVDLLDPSADIPDFLRLVETAAADIGNIGWIVIDTLARAIAGGDENSGEDMGRLIRHADMLQKVPSAPHVTLIHHSGKDAAKGARGWSGLRAAIDTEIEINREQDALYSTVQAVKQRDLTMDFDEAFILERQVLGQNKYDEDVTSCTVQVWDVPVKPVSNRSELSPVQQYIFDVVAALSVSDRFVTFDALRDELDARGFKEMYTRKGEPKEVKSVTSNARIALKKKGYIDFDGAGIWLMKK